MSEDARQVTPATVEVVPVKEVVESGLLWAFNQFVGWPLGFALRASRVQGDWVNLDVIQHREEDGHVETIESDPVGKFDGVAFDRWQAFRELVTTRLNAMPFADADGAFDRLRSIGLDPTVDADGKWGLADRPPKAHWVAQPEPEA